MSYSLNTTIINSSNKQKPKNAVILCHNYQIDPIQRISDYVGDSLGLARQAAKTDAEIIPRRNEVGDAL